MSSVEMLALSNLLLVIMQVLSWMARHSQTREIEELKRKLSRFEEGARGATV